MAARGLLAVVVLWGGVCGGVVPGIACAGEGPRAALVIDTGAAVTTYCVALPEESVSGIDLVELAGEQHGLDYSLGFGGEAVCRLEGVGPDGDDCFGDYPRFWGYWHGDGSGGWQWAGSGAGSASIEDGDVDGWSWGEGDNGSTHQAPPETEYADVCPVVAAPAPPKESRKRASGGGDRPGPGGAAPEDVDAAEPVAPATLEEPRRPRAREIPHEREHADPAAPVDATPSPEATALASRPASGDLDGGPPLTGLVGLAAAGALGVAAWRSARRRKAA